MNLREEWTDINNEMLWTTVDENGAVADWWISKIKKRDQELEENINPLKTILEKIRLREYDIEAEAVRDGKVYNATTQAWAITGLKYLDLIEIITNKKL